MLPFAGAAAGSRPHWVFLFGAGVGQQKVPLAWSSPGVAGWVLVALVPLSPSGLGRQEACKAAAIEATTMGLL